MVFRRIVATAAVFLLAVGVLWGQSDTQTVEDRTADRVEQLNDNVNRLSVTISLDRTTPYFPYELATITVTIKNATSEALEIPDPNNPDMQKFRDQVKRGSRWVDAESEDERYFDHKH